MAVLADVHQSYDELHDAVASINADTSVDFVLLVGDVTQYGYAGEYRFLSDILPKFRAPVLVGIGNHDQQANGNALFRRYFGSPDFSFAWRGYLFVFFDGNARNTPSSIPDWDWLENAMAYAGDSLHPIPVCHSPPFSDQLDSAKSRRLVNLYRRWQATIVIGAHSHHFEFSRPYDDGIPYLIANTLRDREYVLVSLKAGQAEIEKVFF